jgi:hypothetical protein
VVRWPAVRISLRQGARIIHENKRVVVRRLVRSGAVGSE